MKTLIFEASFAYSTFYKSKVHLLVSIERCEIYSFLTFVGYVMFS